MHLYRTAFTFLVEGDPDCFRAEAFVHCPTEDEGKAMIRKKYPLLQHFETFELWPLPLYIPRGGEERCPN